jgi:hypothetical protein
MNTADFSNCRDERDRSKKDCVCGGHNLKNVKRNLHYSSTRKRLGIRKTRRQLAKLRNFTKL